MDILLSEYTALKRKAKEDIEGLVSHQIMPCKICGHKFGEDPTLCLECDYEKLNGNFEWEGIGQAIDERPTVDVVRCKDCKHQSVYCTTVDCNMRTTYSYFCVLHGTYHESDFFCADGERRTDE